MSALPMRRSSRQVPELVTPLREQRARKCSGAGGSNTISSPLIGRAVAETAQREPRQAGGRLRHQIARINRLHAFEQRQRAVARRMVTNIRSLGSTGAPRIVGEGRRDRAALATATDRRGRCAPACPGGAGPALRIAAGSMLKSTPATMIGIKARRVLWARPASAATAHRRRRRRQTSVTAANSKSGAGEGLRPAWRRRRGLAAWAVRLREIGHSKS